MRINYIEWKNIFAYGEELQKLTYNDGNLVLLQGRSGAGKSTILSLPSLLIYGKLDKLKNSKSSIANRTNKNGWIRGEIVKGKYTYIIERSFSPNNLTVWKDGTNIENFGSKDAQEYIESEIVDIPMQTFNNMIAISMKRFKSFLTMSTPDRKQIIDRVFNLEIVNIAFEKIKKDAREVGNAINSNNTTLFQLQQTLNQALGELAKVQEKTKSSESQAEIDENISIIKKCQDSIHSLNEKYQEESLKQQGYITEINQLRQKQYEVNANIHIINEKIKLFAQDKCPTCGTSFSSESFSNLKSKLQELKAEKEKNSKDIENQIQDCNDSNSIIQDNLLKIQNAGQLIQTKVNELTTRNAVIEQEMKSSSECQGINAIITSTNEQIKNIKNTLSENSIQLSDLQNLALVFSIDGVKQKVINNYLPLLNAEIAQNLELVNFPYQIEIDSKFEPHMRELGTEVQPETLSDGEETRIDLVILCSLFKLLKRRYPSMNILFIDEVISSLGVEDSEPVLEFLKAFAKNNNLCVFIVSHTSLSLDHFDKIISVVKNGFSRMVETIPTL